MAGLRIFNIENARPYGPGGYNPSLGKHIMPRFVIQEHTKGNEKHWDLMLQRTSDDTLATWQVPTPPSQWGNEPVACIRISDHRLEYLRYEGSISGDRGHVRIVAVGTYQPIEIERYKWQLSLQGDTINGQLELKRTNDDKWQLEFQGVFE